MSASSSSSSSSSSSDHKHKGLHHPPRDGITGMNPGTQKHFAKVKQRMAEYVGSQEGLDYDALVHHAPAAPKHRKFLNSLFADGHKAPHAAGHAKTPSSSHKNLDHLGLATPQSGRRVKKAL